MKRQFYIYFTTALSFILIAIDCSGGLEEEPMFSLPAGYVLSAV
jgi:hypothetical protein